MSQAGRLSSVDALRGATVAAMLLVNDAGDWSHVYLALEHAEWNGFSPPDGVFPLFLFVMGVSVSLALVPRLERGQAAGELARQVLLRSFKLFGLGLALQVLSWAWLTPGEPLRWLGVLQRIGHCYALAAGVVIACRRPAGQWAALLALLCLHTSLLAAGGTLQPFVNLSDRLDALVLGPHAYRYQALTGLAHDPEGLLGTLGATATVLLGVRAGQWLKEGRPARMLLGGFALWLAGQAITPWLPLNKNLWTASFVLWTGGASMVLLWAAHALVDRRGWPALGRSFGVNAIAAYSLAWVMAVALEGSGLSRQLYRTAFSPAFADPRAASAAYAIAFTAMMWMAMAWLGRRGWRWSL